MFIKPEVNLIKRLQVSVNYKLLSDSKTTATLVKVLLN